MVKFNNVPKPKDSDKRSKTAARKSQGTSPKQSSQIPVVPVDLQQSLLDVFKTSFSATFGNDLASLIQTVKGHLFNRDFTKAFGAEELLEAYAVRWSPSRALAYLDLFCSLPQVSGLLKPKANQETLVEELQSLSIEQAVEDEVSATSISSESRTRLTGRVQVTCLGGGAGAEIAALAACLSRASLSGDDCALTSPNTKDGSGDADARSVSDVPLVNGLAVKVIDIADWSEAITKLKTGAIDRLLLPKSTLSFEDWNEKSRSQFQELNLTFKQADLLSMSVEELAPYLRSSQLVTLMFTLNELYSTSMAKTTNLLLTLTYLLSPGTFLLVVDSPGSYSTIDIGNISTSQVSAQKKYPMRWLLDHTLLDASSIGTGKNAAQESQWAKVETAESRWFRLPKGLGYPLELEDMRYQFHLYRRL